MKAFSHSTRLESFLRCHACHLTFPSLCKPEYQSSEGGDSGAFVIGLEGHLIWVLMGGNLQTEVSYVTDVELLRADIKSTTTFDAEMFDQSIYKQGVRTP